MLCGWSDVLFALFCVHTRSTRAVCTVKNSHFPLVYIQEAAPNINKLISLVKSMVVRTSVSMQQLNTH
jgi:hypothetical protein